MDHRLLDEQVTRVSRSFAFVISQLQEPLRSEVQIAYLLFRLGDNVEDTSSLSPSEKDDLLTRLLECFEAGMSFERILADQGGVGDWRDLTAGEKDLFRYTDRIIDAFAELDPAARRALLREGGNMFRGMTRFQLQRRGGYVFLEDESELDEYCYYVAGTVGDYLTERFLAQMPDLGPDARSRLIADGRALALVLQVTNILRDFRDDHQHQHIFYPQSVFERFDPPHLLEPERQGEVLRAGARMIAWLMPSIRAAGRYITTLPATQRRIRIFCTIPYVMALKTLLAVLGNPRIFGAESVKITRWETRLTVLTSQAIAPLNPVLDGWFRAHWWKIERKIQRTLALRN